MQVLLVDPARLLVPAVVRQQRRVPGRDGAHLHGAGRPLDGAEVVESVVEDEGRRLTLRGAVSGVGEPRSLRYRIP